MKRASGKAPSAAPGNGNVPAHNIGDADAGLQFLDGSILGRVRIVRGPRRCGDRWLRSLRLCGGEELLEIIRTISLADKEIRNIAAVAHVVGQMHQPGMWDHLRHTRGTVPSGVVMVEADIYRG